MIQKLILLITVGLLFSCSISNKINGKYSGGMKFWNYKVTLNSDSTFNYSLNAHLASDSATGIYSFQNDTTLLFRYNYNKDDSVQAAAIKAGTTISFDDALIMIYSNFRDDTAVFKNGRIYFKGVLLRKSR